MNGQRLYLPNVGRSKMQVPSGYPSFTFGGEKDISTRMGFEPTRAEHIGLAVQRLNHSATVSLALSK